MNKELEEAIKVLKEIQETNRAWLKETKEERCEEIYLRDIEAIETALKKLKRLQEDYIEKDKIREKIEELNKNKDMISGGYAISILEELLEGK